MATNSTNFIKLYPDKNQYWEVGFCCRNVTGIELDRRQREKIIKKGMLGGGGVGKGWAGEESDKVKERRGKR